jgi:ABC-type oligopeptide transport system substrate-binding subunit
MKKLFLFLLPLLMITSCGKGPETVTVNPETSELFTAPDSVITEADSDDDEFVHIKIGESASINSLDPLFAESGSEWRAIHLIYETLVNLDENGDPAPGLAKRWAVNDDSTQFVFHLNTTTHFHDSPFFESNTGRRVVASDIKYIFDRMARNNVPDFTANHFKDIVGFSAYHTEQTFIKDPDRRVYSTIEGIRAQNDSAVVFIMNSPAGDLLNRLAHPMTSVYPKESVRSQTKPIQQAVGTGAFRFIQKEEHAHLLTVNENYSGDQPDIDRLDIISGLTERDLFQDFARMNLNALLELGPSSILTVADSTGRLLQNYYQNYSLSKTGFMSDYPLYFNQNSGQANQLNKVIPSLDRRALSVNPALGTISIDSVETSGATDPSEGSQFIVTQTKHPFYVFLLNNTASQISQTGRSFSMSASYAMSDKTTFSTLPYPDTELFLNWESPLYILTHADVSGIRINHHSWNLDLSELQLSRSN